MTFNNLNDVVVYLKAQGIEFMNLRYTGELVISTVETADQMRPKLDTAGFEVTDDALDFESGTPITTLWFMPKVTQ